LLWHDNINWLPSYELDCTLFGVCSQFATFFITFLGFSHHNLLATASIFIFFASLQQFPSPALPFSRKYPFQSQQLPT
jgi:hypothetical protein